MYTLNDAKFDCLKEFQSLGLDTPNPLWLDFIIKLIVEDFYKQPFILNGALADIGLRVTDDGEIPINDKWARDIIVNGVMGVYYADKNKEELEGYAYNMMMIADEYNEFLMEEYDINE